MGARNPDPEKHAAFIAKMTRINRENKEKMNKKGGKHPWEMGGEAHDLTGGAG